MQSLSKIILIQFRVHFILNMCL